MCIDPTAGPSASDQSTWYLDESTLSDNIKKTLHKFCGPSPVVFRYVLLNSSCDLVQVRCRLVRGNHQISLTS